jgi:hypothetical protein
MGVEFTFTTRRGGVEELHSRRADQPPPRLIVMMADFSVTGGHLAWQPSVKLPSVTDPIVVSAGTPPRWGNSTILRSAADCAMVGGCRNSTRAQLVTECFGDQYFLGRKTTVESGGSDPRAPGDVIPVVVRR